MRINYTLTDSYNRDPGKDFTPEAIAAQIAEFEARGGKPAVLPPCTTSELLKLTERQKSDIGAQSRPKRQHVHLVLDTGQERAAKGIGL